MVEFLGLPSVEAVLSFHETEQPVRTASVNQAREAIDRTSAARWRMDGVCAHRTAGVDRRLLNFDH
jgi:hypothetical protein